MKNSVNPLVLISILFSLFLFVQCKNQKKPAASEGDEVSQTETDIVKDKPKVYLVAVVADPTGGDVSQCTVNQCAGLNCDSVPPSSKNTNAGDKNYSLCVCYQNCSTDSTSIIGSYSYNGGMGVNFDSGAVGGGDGVGSELTLNLDAASTAGDKGTVVFMDASGDTLNVYGIDFN